MLHKIENGRAKEHARARGNNNNRPFSAWNRDRGRNGEIKREWEKA